MGTKFDMIFGPLFCSKYWHCKYIHSTLLGRYPIEAKFTEREYLEAIAKIENSYLKYSDYLGIKGGFAVLYSTELTEQMPSEALSILAAKSKYKLIAMFSQEDSP
jgi:hypothetical protein